MNKRPLRQCKKVGCTELTRSKEGYCDNHVHTIEEVKAKRNKNYDRNVRGKRDKVYTDFYSSKEWKVARKEALNIYNGIDVYAYCIDGEVILANTVHHIVELKDDWSKRIDINNLFPTSEKNHNKIHSLYVEDKVGTQNMLRELLERFRNQFKN